MNRNVFEIQDLECAYDHHSGKGAKVLLKIGRLSLPMGKVTVILGQSGSGKSTLIETLGLMNNTIRNGTISYFSDDSRFVINRAFWRHRQEIARIRNRHFSFVFQNDFLMPYYSSAENMLIGKLINGAGKVMQVETSVLVACCRQMGLDYEEISRKRPVELSVGQKQRLSFIRAMVKDCSVIFGDEPTGNLDEMNSELLMDVLKKSISMEPRKSAVLVSHNITLSVAKADFIILLSPAGEVYEVKPVNVFSRTHGGWQNGGDTLLCDAALTEMIRSVVTSGQPN